MEPNSTRPIFHLPHFTAGPIQYGLKSADVLSMGEAVMQRLVDTNLTTVEIPYNVSRSKVNFKAEIIAEGAFAGLFCKSCV